MTVNVYERYYAASAEVNGVGRRGALGGGRAGGKRSGPRRVAATAGVRAAERTGL